MSDTNLNNEIQYEEEILEDDYEDENETFDNDQIIRAKWSFDGATNLLEAAEKLEVYATWLRELESQGWRLRSSIEDDYGYLYQIDEHGNEIESALD